MEETRWKEKIKPLDENAMEEARAHWMTVGKPLFSLGSLEDAVIQIAGIKGTSDFELLKARADHYVRGQRCGRRRRDTDRTGSNGNRGG